MHHKTVYKHAVMAALALFLCLPALGGCGKQGRPSPKKTQDTFTITGAAATVMNACLVTNGVVEGAIQNVDTVTIEVAPIVASDECPGCPFVPQEWSEYDGPAIRLDMQSGRFGFSFCPSTPAPMYRWRLVGKNVYRGLPHATTTPQVVKAANGDLSF